MRRDELTIYDRAEKNYEDIQSNSTRTVACILREYVCVALQIGGAHGVLMIVGSCCSGSLALAAPEHEDAHHQSHQQRHYSHN